MANLDIASRASQALTLPVSLVASYIKELDSNPSITITFEDVDALDSADGAYVKLTNGKNSPVFGLEPVISSILTLSPKLKEISHTLVSWNAGRFRRSCGIIYYRLLNGLNEYPYSPRWISKSSRAPFWNSNLI